MFRFPRRILHHQELLQRLPSVGSEDPAWLRVRVDSKVVHKVLKRSNHQRVEKIIDRKSPLLRKKLFQRVNRVPVEFIG